MKIIFHKDFQHIDYASDGASVPNRMEGIVTKLKEEGKYDFISPVPASSEDLAIVHSQRYIDNIKKDKKLFEMASLAAGGAIKASDIAFRQEPAFACIRPPGHHASKHSSWGYCVFSNLAISLLSLKKRGLIKSAFVLDFDAHKGDGTINALQGWN